MSNSFLKKNKKFDILLWAGIIDIDNEDLNTIKQKNFNAKCLIRNNCLL